MRAVIEVLTEVGKAKDVYEEVRKIENVKEAYLVTGRCDIVAIVEVDELKALGELVLSKIHAIKGVVRTETLVCVG